MVVVMACIGAVAFAVAPFSRLCRENCGNDTLLRAFQLLGISSEIDYQSIMGEGRPRNQNSAHD